ncbi:MAG: GntR family transcriptional regulator [Planctomycetes bacterium]|nr:GntR family transcriptional regulator [Planctomycetota bacterium]
MAHNREKKTRAFDPTHFPLELFSRSSAGRKVIKPLRLGIILGDYAPGQRLIEAELAERYRVSRGSVRMALQVLESEGLIRRLRNGGKEVRGFSRQDAIDTHEFRWLLEKRALEIAFKLRQPYSTPLLDILRLIEEQMAGGPKSDWYVTDIRFHRAIMMTARNSPLLKAWEINSPLIHAIMTLNASAGYHSRYIEEFYRKHKAIFDSIVTRDRKAFELLETHIDDAKAITSELYDQIEAKRFGQTQKDNNAAGEGEPAMIASAG